MRLQQIIRTALEFFGDEVDGIRQFDAQTQNLLVMLNK